MTAGLVLLTAVGSWMLGVLCVCAWALWVDRRDKRLRARQADAFVALYNAECVRRAESRADVQIWGAGGGGSGSWTAAKRRRVLKLVARDDGPRAA